MIKQHIHLSDHFTYGRLLRFTLPSVIMMIFTSVYSVVDGLFVSNFVGKTAFAAVNLTMPMLVIMGSFGYMFGAGGGALIARNLGERNREKANRLFSLFVYLSIGFSILMMILGLIIMRSVVMWFGAEGQLLEDCMTYGRIFILALPAWILLYEFQLFFVTAEKPVLGLAVTVAAGLTNIILDALFIVVFRWGIAGAAAASAVSQVVGGVFPLIYFGCRNSSLLRLTAASFDFKAVVKCCINGSSELMSGISMSFVGIIYNIQLMKYIGEDGVAAYGVLMYVSMIFMSVFLGYSNGSAPVFGFHYGAGNLTELRSLLRKSIFIIVIFSAGMFVVSEVMAYPVSMVFVGYDRNLTEVTLNGFFIYSFAFIFMGMAIFSSAFFTALNNGPVSALISFLRTLVFEFGAVLLLPAVFGVNGIWCSVVVAESMAALVGIIFMAGYRKRYLYGCSSPA